MTVGFGNRGVDVKSTYAESVIALGYYPSTPSTLYARKNVKVNFMNHREKSKKLAEIHLFYLVRTWTTNAS